MHVTPIQLESSFSKSARQLGAMVDCRPALEERDRSEIFRLRYAAYSREGALPAGAPEVFTDADDEAPNCIVFGFYIEGALAASIRIHVAGPRWPGCPSLAVFPEYLKPMVDAGLTIVDPTRFVIDESAARSYPKLAYLCVRIPWVAARYVFDADIGLATVRAEHQPFYRRLFGHTVVCGARPYPSLAKPISLMVLDIHKESARIHARYPFMQSGSLERRRIFESVARRSAILTESLAEQW